MGTGELPQLIPVSPLGRGSPEHKKKKLQNNSDEQYPITEFGDQVFKVEFPTDGNDLEGE